MIIETEIMHSFSNESEICKPFRQGVFFRAGSMDKGEFIDIRWSKEGEKIPLP